MTHRNGTLILPADAGGAVARRQAELVLLGHDLRAALSDVLAGLDTLQAADLADAPRSQLDRARAAADALSGLLNGALDMAMDTPLAMSCPPESLALVSVLDRIEARWTAPAADRGMPLTIDLAPGTPGMVVTDRVALERILSNLVGNAVVHATTGPVRIAVAPGQDSGPVITVTDAGPGLPARLLSRAASFDLPPVPPDGTARRGLGLFIARDLARRIGADLTLSNAPGGGAVARLTLPADAVPVFPAVDTMPDLTGLHILLAEDSTSQRQATTALLRFLGAEVTATGDGLAARDIAMAGGVDAVLMDALLPRLPGEAAIAAIRACPGAAGRVPVLAVTASNDAATHARLRAAGADGVLVKPVVCPVALGLAVLAVRPGWHRPPQPPADAPAPDPLDPTACDPAMLDRLLLLVGPGAAADLCSRIRADLAALRGGIERSAAPPVDMASLRRHAHGLIALAGTCGASGLHRAAQRLHDLAEAGTSGPDPSLIAALDAGFAALMARIGERADGLGP